MQRHSTDKPLLQPLIEDPALFVPNSGGQQGFMDDYLSRYCALAGGWYAGKTWAGARKLLDLHVFNAFDDAGGATGVDSCVIAPTYQLAETINIPEMKGAMAEAGVKYRFVADQKKYWFELPQLKAGNDPSLIYVRTADAPDKITGFTVGAIWGDEVARWKRNDADPTGDPLLQAKGRLRDVRARCIQFLMTFTHEGDATKVYEDFESSPKPSHRLYRAGTFENPYAKEFGEGLQEQLTPELAGQYLGGKAANFRGNAMYSAFDATVGQNVDESVRLDDALPLQLAVDFNISPGMHGVIGQHFPALDMLTARHLIHAPRMDVQRMMLEFKRMIDADYGGWRWPELWLFGDASGSSKWAGSGESCWDIVVSYLKQWGITYRWRVPAANPPIADRVNSVNCACKDIGGAIHYKVHPDCKGLINDYRKMRWDDEGEMEKNDRKLSHASDAEGYRIHVLRPVRQLRRATPYAGSAA